jgi:hypothetical protein
MAFARFFYNRICLATEGDYEVLPSSMTGISVTPTLVHASGSAGRTTQVLEETPDGMQMDTHEGEHINADDKVSEPPLPISNTRVLALDILRAAVTPDEDPSTIPKLLLSEFTTRLLDSYSKLDSDAARAGFLECAQDHRIRLALSRMKKFG